MRIALIQMNNSPSIATNIAKITKFVKQVPADYYVFPESVITGYTSDVSDRQTISRDDECLGALLQLATAKKCRILAGANIRDDGEDYISYLQIGDHIDYYDKTHLGLKEHQFFTAGNHLTIFNGALKAGVSLCIESHFPDIAQTLRLAGAECLVVPFASPTVCGSREALWKKYLPARAYDNQMYVFATNLTGLANGHVYSGGMMAINPRGDIIASYFGEDERLITVDVDIEQLRAIRKKKKLNYIARRRPELYGGTDGLSKKPNDH